MSKGRNYIEKTKINPQRPVGGNLFARFFVCSKGALGLKIPLYLLFIKGEEGDYKECKEFCEDRCPMRRTAGRKRIGSALGMNFADY